MNQFMHVFFKSRRLVCKTEDWKPHWKIIFQKHQDSILANIIIWNNHKVVCMLFFFAEVKTLCYDWDQFAGESKAAWQLCSWRSSWHCLTSCYGQIMMSTPLRINIFVMQYSPWLFAFSRSLDNKFGICCWIGVVSLHTEQTILCSTHSSYLPKSKTADLVSTVGAGPD